MSGEFPAAVRACPALALHLNRGLQALKAADRNRIKVDDSRRLTGSIDTDTALAAACPNAPRWDYGVGHTPRAGGPDRAHWIEVHPCTDGEVKLIEAKVRWLRNWLHENASELAMLRAIYVWVSSGSTGLSPKSQSRRKLAEQGVLVAGSSYTIQQQRGSLAAPKNS